MADQESARPTGDRVSRERTGLLRSRMSLPPVSRLKRQAVVLSIVFASAHVMGAAWLAGDAHNPIWPSLLFVYVGFFATLFCVPELFKTGNHVVSLVLASPAPTPFTEPQQPEPLDAGHRHPACSHQITKQTATSTNTRNRPAATSHLMLQNASSEDWTDLLSQVSHELRTPLNAVIGFSDVINSEMLGPLENPKYREYMAHIRDCGLDLLKSAEDTLVMTSLLTATPAPGRAKATSALHTVITDAWQSVAETTSVTEVTFLCEGLDHVNVRADAPALKQTFINLLSEALKECKGRGTIEVVAIRICDAVEISVSAWPSRMSEAERLPTLALAIARALLDLQGAPLTTEVDQDGRWRATTVLECDLQTDFFA